MALGDGRRGGGGDGPVIVQPPPQPAQMSQEQMAYIQAKANISLLEPRLQTTRSCIESLQHGLDFADFSETLIAVIARVQLIQLQAALKEGEEELRKFKMVVAQIENPVKIFRPAGFTPPPSSGGAA